MPELRRMEHQVEAVKLINNFKGKALIADEMGLGKTVESLLWVKHKMEHKLPLLIVSPAVMKWEWMEYVHDILKKPCDVLEGRTVKGKLLVKADITIINYDILINWEAQLKKMGFKTLIADECHYCKSRSAKRTRSLYNIAKQIPYKMALSGTPLINNPEELWTTLRLLHPTDYYSFYRFAHRYCKPVKKPWGWDYKGASNLDELHRILKNTMMIRRLKKDILNLPEKTRHVIPLDLSNINEYLQVKTNFINWLSKRSVHKAIRAKKAETLVQLGYLKRTAAEGKIKQAIEWIKNRLEGEGGKIVVFAKHKKIIKELQASFKNRCVIIDGSVSSQKRVKIVQAFQNNDKIDVFIGNIDAAKEGITLTAANTVVFVELGWTPGEHRQAEDRIHRIGQKNYSYIYYLVARNTIEEKLAKLLKEKQEIIDNVLDGNTNENDFNIMRELEKEYIRK